MSKRIIHDAMFDTDPLQQVSISLDIGIIPTGYPNAGKWIITIQAHPLDNRRDAQKIADAMREALNARLGIKMEGATHG